MLNWRTQNSSNATPATGEDGSKDYVDTLSNSKVIFKDISTNESIFGEGLNYSDSLENLFNKLIKKYPSGIFPAFKFGGYAEIVNS